MSNYEIARIRLEVAMSNLEQFARALETAEDSRPSNPSAEDQVARARLKDSICTVRKKATASGIPIMKSMSRILRGVMSDE